MIRIKIILSPKPLKIIKDNSKVKFTESLDCAIRLGVDPRHADQMIRGTVSLPNGTGKQVRVLVIAKGAKAQEALDAGADFAGFEDYLEKIKTGWADVDVIVATPDSMGELGKLGKVLGPKGLMPNPKSGTVTMDVANAVKEVKAGKIEFRVEKAGIVHASLGKLNFENEKLAENVRAFLKYYSKVETIFCQRPICEESVPNEHNGTRTQNYQRRNCSSLKSLRTL